MQTNLVSIVIVIVVVLIILAILNWVFGWKRLDKYDFVADEVVVEITHPTTASADNIVAAIGSFLSTSSNDSQQVGVNQDRRVDKNWRKRLRPPSSSSRVVTFPSSTDETFSLVPVSLVPFSLIRLGGHKKRDLRPNDVIRVLNSAYAELQNLPLTVGKGISVQSISPNLFVKNLHHGGATGGPGSWPLEADAQQQSVAGVSAPKKYEFRLVGPMGSLKPYKDKLSVGKLHVAILDTVPTKELEQAAQNIINNSDPASIDFSLIQSLFVPVLDYKRYSNPTELTALEVYTPPPYHYKMPDHGMFIAGTVQTIAPRANLHLYEVLNSWGLGTLTSMAQGMINAVNDHYKQGQTCLIVHCSFMLDLANLDETLKLTNPKVPGLAKKSTLGVLTWITGLKNVVVVAAAGNEARLITPRPHARYPAAFKGVVGVGALPEGNPTNSSGAYIPASYSNLSYDPPNKSASEGFMTFGGELDTQPTNTVPISTKGVLGVYVGKLLRDATNANMSNLQLTLSRRGWGHWGGTSFAAPVITGLLAAQPGDPSISTTFPTPATSPITTDGANAILVKQG